MISGHNTIVKFVIAAIKKESYGNSFEPGLLKISPSSSLNILNTIDKNGLTQQRHENIPHQIE